MVSGSLLAFGHFRMDSTLRGRGKDDTGYALLKQAGITPACAGKSNLVQVSPAESRDHPRVCGEKSMYCPGMPYPGGSPPRVRGKGGAIRFNAIAVRITPACAGKRLKKSKKINDPSPLAHRISFSFSYTANVRRQSVSARCAPETSRPKYVASVVSL